MLVLLTLTGSLTFWRLKSCTLGAPLVHKSTISAAATILGSQDKRQVQNNIADSNLLWWYRIEARAKQSLTICVWETIIYQSNKTPYL